MRTPSEPITARARVRGGCVSAAAIPRCMRRLQTFAIDFRGVVRVRSFGCGRRFGSAGAGVFCSLQNSYHETLTVERRSFAETRFDLPSDAGAPDGAETACRSIIAIAARRVSSRRLREHCTFGEPVRDVARSRHARTNVVSPGFAQCVACRRIPVFPRLRWS